MSDALKNQTITDYHQLVEKIAELDYHYYVLDKPLKSDFEYDQLLAKLSALEHLHPDWKSPHSPTLRIGGRPLESFKKVQHRTPMLSLSNSYSVEDIFEFESKLKRALNSDSAIEFFAEPKYDGLAMELVYEFGSLTIASTRGDGTTGEDVTHNIRTIRAIPLHISQLKDCPVFEVRGEVIINKNDFVIMNSEQEEAGQNVFANPRNAAAGTVRQLDPRVAAARPLRFFAYGIGITDGFEFESQEAIRLKLREFGLPVSPNDLTSKCPSAEEVSAFYGQVGQKRPDLPFEIDGIVIKVNSVVLQSELGIIGRSPRWATAAKYPPNRVETVIENIIIQVGRTGALTPVALMSPVKVGGVTISQATLHNQSEIDRKDIRIGDHVWVQRAGDVIPEVVEVIPEKRPGNATKFRIPDHCPVCESKALRPEGEAVSRCTNTQCPAVLKESFKHFVSRKALNIEKVGDRLIDELVDAKLLTRFQDFYKLTKDSLLKLPRKGDKSVSNILESINKSRATTRSRFFYGLGIRYVGEQTSKILAKHFNSISALKKASVEELSALPDIGPKVAESIYLSMQDEHLVRDAHNLETIELEFEAPKETTGNSLEGKTFVITGTLPISRDAAANHIEANGGKILSSVSGKLNYLVVGDDPGSKVEKAQKLNIEILSWSDVLSMTKAGS